MIYFPFHRHLDIFSTFQNTFRYIFLRKEQEEKVQRLQHKKYIWPNSFPDCTSSLRMYNTREFIMDRFMNKSMYVFHLTRKI